MNRRFIIVSQNITPRGKCTRCDNRQFSYHGILLPPYLSPLSIQPACNHREIKARVKVGSLTSFGGFFNCHFWMQRVKLDRADSLLPLPVSQRRLELHHTADGHIGLDLNRFKGAVRRLGKEMFIRTLTDCLLLQSPQISIYILTRVPLLWTHDFSYLEPIQEFEYILQVFVAPATTLITITDR